MHLRKPHRKSRLGCLTCKKRRKKCDEKRPVCTRCATSSKTCVYTTVKASPRIQVTKCDTPSTSPGSVPGLVAPTSAIADDADTDRQQSPLTTPLTPADSSIWTYRLESDVATSDSTFLDAELYAHFIDHACRTTASLHDRVVMQIGIGKLALDSLPVLHAVLALSAACICCDIISSKDIDVERLRQIHRLGLHHHTLSLAQMRILVANPTKSGSESMLAIAILLPPFALSLLQIQYWMQSTRGLQSNVSFTPRDAILLLRGIRPAIESLNCTRAPESEVREAVQPFDDPWTKLFDPESQNIHPQVTPVVVTGYSHHMFPVLSATYHAALTRLQSRVEANSCQASSRAQKTSISDAFSTLNDLMLRTFASTSVESEDVDDEQKWPITPNSLLSQVSGWLSALANRPSRLRQNKPLARALISFFTAVPQCFVDLLLPLLDPDANPDPDGNHSAADKLTSSQALALDIYAHWLVLFCLAEAETWWVGKFPTKALEELVARYGEGLQLHASMEGRWWPLSMLEIAQRLGEWK